MADYCKQCGIDYLGEDCKDLKGLGDGKPLEPGWGYQVLCEGCGPTLVDDDGKCIADCDRHHEVTP
jgi:hypothetical protein